MRTGFLFCLVVLFACGEDTPPAGVYDAGSADTAIADAGVGGDSGDSGDSGGPSDAAMDPDTAPGPDSCVPDCSGRECGSDSCGGMCGTCGDEERCGGLGMCEAIGAGTCPAAGPTGSEVGDVAPNVTLLDCDNNPVELHSLCGSSASWIYNFSEWCPTCQRFAGGDAPIFLEQFAGQGVNAFLVVAERENFGQRATQMDCLQVQSRYGLDLTVLYDPDNALGMALDLATNSETVVFDDEMRIVYSEHYDHSGIPTSIQEILDR